MATMKAVEKLSVEEHLNRVSYAPNPDYVPSAFALEFMVFIKLVNGERGEEHASPVVHMQMLDALVDDSTNTANLCARGFAKTTLFAEYLFLYLAVYGELPNFGDVPLAIYVSDSIENGVKNLRKNIEHRYNNSTFLQKYIAEVRFTDIRLEFKNVSGKVFIVKSYGAQTGVRGAKEMGIRPVLAILDDLISDEDARSDTIIASIEDTVYKAVTYALHPSRQKIIWSGTPFNSRDPLYKAVESGAWRVNVFPVCEQFPCEKKDFRGAWEERFPYEYVLGQYERAMRTGKIAAFNQELMLRIMSDEDRLILDTDFQWFNTPSVTKNRSYYNFYITTDFATSTEASADYSFILVWALNSNGDYFLVDGMAERQQMDANIDALFRYVSEYRPDSVGIEVTGQQQALISWFQNEMQRRNIFFNIAKEKGSTRLGMRPTTDKMARFRLMEPLFKMGKMYFPTDKKESPFMKELMNELTLASFSGFKSKHDDGIDAVSMLGSMPTWKPSFDHLEAKETTVVSRKSSVWGKDDDEDKNPSHFSSYVV